MVDAITPRLICVLGELLRFSHKSVVGCQFRVIAICVVGRRAHPHVFRVSPISRPSIVLTILVTDLVVPYRWSKLCRVTSIGLSFDVQFAIEGSRLTYHHSRRTLHASQRQLQIRIVHFAYIPETSVGVLYVCVHVRVNSCECVKSRKTCDIGDVQLGFRRYSS